jgi:TetR/AcrR family transcriptional repressor of bet genes
VPGRVSKPASNTLSAKIPAPAEAAKPAEKLSRARQRAKLIDACISALYLHGPSRTTIDKVVSIADMSPGIVNFYFDTKASLLLSALEHLAVEFEERVLAPVSALRERPVQALEQLIALYLDADMASPRKVSVWYSFWGEASSRREYHAICGKRDVAFAELVGDLMVRLIAQTGAVHLDADAVGLGLIGALEMMWQEIAFQTEADLDREAARRRCRAYLRSIFPSSFADMAAAQIPVAAAAPLPGSVYASTEAFQTERAGLFHGRWQWLGHESDFAWAGDYVSADFAGEPVFAICDGGGKVAAFRNACSRRPHAIAPMPAGNLGDMMVCAVDGLCYRLDGAAEGGRHGGLVELPAARNRELLYVLCDSQAAAREETPPGAAQPALGRLVPVAGWTTEACHADWKLVVEHWADVTLATPGNIRTAALGGEAAAERTTDADCVIWRMKLEGQGEGWLGRCYAGLLRRLDADPETLVWARQILLPNLLIETRPEGATIRQVLPSAAGRCSIRTRHYIRAEGGRIERALSWLSRRMAQDWARQDAHIVASTQNALCSPLHIEETRACSEDNALWGWLRRVLPGYGRA